MNGEQSLIRAATVTEREMPDTMMTGHLALSILVASLVLCLSVLAGHPPLAWLLLYSMTGITALMGLVFFRLREDLPR